MRVAYPRAASVSSPLFHPHPRPTDGHGDSRVPLAAGLRGDDVRGFMVLGMIMTAMPAIHAIPHVVAAAPGIVTHTDLPVPLPRGVVAR